MNISLSPLYSAVQLKELKPSSFLKNLFVFFTYITLLAFLSPSILAPSQASFAVHSFFVLSLLLSAVLSLLTTALVSGDFKKKLFLIEG